MGRTRREILALKENLPVFRLLAMPQADLSGARLEQLPREIPLPKFNDDSRLQHLDRLEQEAREA